MDAAAEHSDGDKLLVAFVVGTDRVEVVELAFAVADVDAYDVIDGDNLAVDVHAGVASHPVFRDTPLPFHHLSAYPIPLHDHGYADAIGKNLFTSHGHTLSLLPHQTLTT